MLDIHFLLYPPQDSRGHEYKLQKPHVRLDVRKFFFSNRIE